MTKTRTPPILVVIAVTALAALAVLVPLSALGQTPPPQGLFIAIPEAFPDVPDVDARAVIIRERGMDVVLLKEEEATPEVLAMALVALRRVREQHPKPEQGQMIPIVGFVIESPMGEAYRASLVEALARLKRRPVSNVGNLGPGRWLRYQGR